VQKHSRTFKKSPNSRQIQRTQQPSWRS